MIIGDVVRAVLYLSIPINLVLGFVDKLTWLYVAQFLASAASLFWTPAKDASVPNLVPPDKLEQANQFSLFTTYGTAPLAGLLFSLVSPDQPVPRHRCSAYFTAQPDRPGAVLQRRHLRGLRADRHVLAARPAAAQPSGGRPAPSVPRRSGTAGGSSARTGSCAASPSAWPARSRPAAWSSASAAPYVRNTLHGGRPAGASCSPRSSSAWPLGMSVGLAAPARLQPAPAVRPVDRVRGAPAGPDRADPEPGRRGRSWSLMLGILRRHRLRHRLHRDRPRGR